MAQEKRDYKGNTFDKEKYQKLMAENLPTLRNKLGLNQSELASLIGITRQTISSIERGERPMMWDTFMSLTFLFRSNETTRYMLPILGLYTPELTNYLNVTDLEKLKK